MHLLLIYDISDDRVRSKVANVCEDYGLDRIQFSAFYGRLSRNLQEELMLRVEGLLSNSAGRVQLIPISTADWGKRLEVGDCVG
jgi:CRISPR-associated protein Cas2